MSSTITYGVASYWAALVTAGIALMQRFGVAPMPALQGIRVSAAQLRTRNHAATTHLVAAKADDRFRPRGRRL